MHARSLLFVALAAFLLMPSASAQLVEVEHGPKTPVVSHCLGFMDLKVEVFVSSTMRATVLGYQSPLFVVGAGADAGPC